VGAVSEAEQSTRSERKDCYEAVLRTVDLNTGRPMLPGQSRLRLKTILCADGQWESEQVDKAVNAAIQNGDLIEWPGLPFRDGTRVTRAEEEDLRELLGEANRWMSELEETIETAAEAIQEANEDE
jgi:hypothetical protein